MLLLFWDMLRVSRCCSFRNGWVGVECHGAITRGRTVTDAYSDAKREPNTELVTDVDREPFVDALTARLAVYSG